MRSNALHFATSLEYRTSKTVNLIQKGGKATSHEEKYGTMVPNARSRRTGQQNGVMPPDELDNATFLKCCLLSSKIIGKEISSDRGTATILGDKQMITSKRELLAWTIVVLQACIIATAKVTSGHLRSHLAVASPHSGALSHDQRTLMNGKPVAYYEDLRRNATASGYILHSGGGKSTSTPSPAGYFNRPILHPISEPALAERKWHSNGSPYINEGLKQGTCWCSADEWCMCTPSLAVDVILLSGDDHIWLVRRADTGLLALMVSIYAERFPIFFCIIIVPCIL